jgi:hypothetical protein
MRFWLTADVSSAAAVRRVRPEQVRFNIPKLIAFDILQGSLRPVHAGGPFFGGCKSP